MGVGYVAVEGHGDVAAVPNLLTRLCADLDLLDVVWMTPIRSRRLAQKRGLREVCELVRTKPDADMLLVFRDEDDGCPAELAPVAARVLADLDLPFPAAVVMATREYESLFLASIDTIAGRELLGPSGMRRPGLASDATFIGDLERKRDVKGWLSEKMAPGVTYKPSVDQLPMTRLVDFSCVRERGLSWFGTLERALGFLVERRAAGAGEVYPPPVGPREDGGYGPSP